MILRYYDVICHSFQEHSLRLLNHTILVLRNEESYALAATSINSANLTTDDQKHHAYFISLLFLFAITTSKCCLAAGMFDLILIFN
jgi:hypothetical protein